ncbi:hypothetical protein EmuJ_000693600 [Echinococcus multilocularis]|uniref:Uncharacterized protein n=1 Tax=Echinococcus multilocularis TaxID=6211 RepID=A0A068YB06_ECHMU|nr:hypothetical protein EmuJ_000693600 [Echinococcus multilocularis]
MDTWLAVQVNTVGVDITPQDGESRVPLASIANIEKCVFPCLYLFASVPVPISDKLFIPPILQVTSRPETN